MPLTNKATVSCVKTTPLGSPLVPLVYIIVQISKGFGGNISDGFSFPKHRNSSHEYDFIPIFAALSFSSFVREVKQTIDLSR
uniref:Long chain acyl-CoA synthetase 1 protein n=1 Tax=Rhizophora mucronata TaxID=61149 RepID=A0A2P2MP81_RHIMU